MNYIKDIINIIYEKHTKHNWDTVMAVVGDEGVGKSTLALHIAEHWYNLMNGQCVEGDIKHICLTREQWLTDLKDMNKYECTVYDEAGDLSSRRAMSQFNIEVMKVYQVIRADNLFTLLVLPSVWELDRYFRERRLRGIFYVYKRGCCAFWNKGRLREMLELNRNRLVRTYWVKSPLLIDNYPLYKGVMLEGYNKKKHEKIADVRANIMSPESSAKDDTLKNERGTAIYRLRHDLKISTKMIAFAYGMTDRNIRYILQHQNGKEKRKTHSNITLTDEGEDDEEKKHTF